MFNLFEKTVEHSLKIGKYLKRQRNDRKCSDLDFLTLRNCTLENINFTFTFC